MKLSTKTRYGTRAMLTLALRYGSGLVSSRAIADQQRLSLKYLEHLLATLRAAGLVHSTRGAQGGHMLSRPPEQISLRQIYESLEGPEGFVACTTNPMLCERYRDCVTQEVWAEMHAACLEILERTTLADLVRRTREKAAEGTQYAAQGEL